MLSPLRKVLIFTKRDFFDFRTFRSGLNVSVLNWIRSFGNEVSGLQSKPEEIEFVEVDEMHSYIGDKKTTVACLPARQGYGLLLIDLAKNSSTSLLAIEAQKQQRGFGRKLNTMK